MQSLLKAFLRRPKKTGQFITTKFQHFMIVGQLGYVKYTFPHFIGGDQRLEFVFYMKTDISPLFKHFK